jgi:hypothetical protein
MKNGVSNVTPVVVKPVSRNLMSAMVEAAYDDLFLMIVIAVPAVGVAAENLASSYLAVAVDVDPSWRMASSKPLTYMVLEDPFRMAHTVPPTPVAAVCLMLTGATYDPAGVVDAAAVPSVPYSVTRAAFETGSMVSWSAVAPDCMMAMLAPPIL